MDEPPPSRKERRATLRAAKQQMRVAVKVRRKTESALAKARRASLRAEKTEGAKLVKRGSLLDVFLRRGSASSSAAAAPAGTPPAAIAAAAPSSSPSAAEASRASPAGSRPGRAERRASLKAEKQEKAMMRKTAKQEAAAQRKERRASLQAERGLQKEQRRAEKLRRKSAGSATLPMLVLGPAAPNRSGSGDEKTNEADSLGTASGGPHPPDAAAPGPAEGVRADAQSEAERAASEARELIDYEARTEHDSDVGAESVRGAAPRGERRKCRERKKKPREEPRHRANTTRRRASLGAVRARARRREEAAAAPRFAGEPPFDVLAPPNDFEPHDEVVRVCVSDAGPLGLTLALNRATCRLVVLPPPRTARGEPSREGAVAREHPNTIRPGDALVSVGSYSFRAFGMLACHAPDATPDLVRRTEVRALLEPTHITRTWLGTDCDATPEELADALIEDCCLNGRRTKWINDPENEGREHHEVHEGVEREVRLFYSPLTFRANPAMQVVTI